MSSDGTEYSPRSWYSINYLYHHNSIYHNKCCKLFKITIVYDTSHLIIIVFYLELWNFKQKQRSSHSPSSWVGRGALPSPSVK